MLADLIREAWRGLWTHRLRTALTMLGVGWGLFAEMLMLSLGIGLHGALHKEFAVTGPERINFFPQLYQVNTQGPPRLKQVRLEPEDVEAVRTHARLVKSVEPELWVGETPIRTAGEINVADVYGVTPAVAPMRNLAVQYGRWLTPEDVAHARRVCTLGMEVAQKLGLDGPQGPGARVTMRGVPLTVVGIMVGHPDQLSRMNSGDDEQVYLPISTARRYFTGMRQDYWTINFEPVHVEQYQAASDEVRAIIAARQGYDGSRERTAWVWGIFDQLKMVYFITLGLNLFLGVAGAVTVFVAGVGVMNIMSVNIAERTNEIGLRKALGANPRYIFWQFFIEAFLMTGVAALTAFGTGVVIMLACTQVTMPRFVPAPTMSPGLALFLFVLTVGVGIFAGTRPARRAARLEPAAALRHT